MATTLRAVEARTDGDLASAARAGDHRAFGELVQRYKGLVSAVAYGVTGSLVQSEEIGQEAFAVAWADLAGLREPDRFRNWICGIARHLGLVWRRGERRRPTAGLKLQRSVNQIASRQPSPLDQMISEEEERVVENALGRLPERYRVVLVLFYREQHSLRKVAELLDLSETGVKQRLFRGRRLLQEQVLATIESVLHRTHPGKRFTTAVLTAIVAMDAEGGPAGHRPVRFPLRQVLLTSAVIASAVGAPVIGVRGRQPDVEPAAAGGSARTVPRLLGAVSGGAGIAPPVAVFPRDVFATDFEEVPASITFQGQVVSGAMCRDHGHCIQGGMNPKSPTVNSIGVGSPDWKERPNEEIFSYNDREVLTFDYWLADGEEVGLTIRDGDQDLNFGIDLRDVVHRRWTRATVRLADLRHFKLEAFRGNRLQDGDGIRSVKVAAGTALREPFYVDNVRVTEYAAGPLPISTAAGQTATSAP